jgi:hypothetical protein
VAIDIQWYTPDKVLLIKIVGTLALDEMISLIQQLEAYKDQNANFHQIYDLTELTKLPGVTEFRQGFRPDLMSMGYVFAVGKLNPMVKFMSSTVIQFTGVRLKTAPTVEDAATQLRQLDPALR